MSDVMLSSLHRVWSSVIVDPHLKCSIGVEFDYVHDMSDGDDVHSGELAAYPQCFKLARGAGTMQSLFSSRRVTR